MIWRAGSWGRDQEPGARGLQQPLQDAGQAALEEVVDNNRGDESVVDTQTQQGSRDIGVKKTSDNVPILKDVTS